MPVFLYRLDRAPRRVVWTLTMLLLTQSGVTSGNSRWTIQESPEAWAAAVRLAGTHEH